MLFGLDRNGFVLIFCERNHWPVKQWVVFCGEDLGMKALYILYYIHTLVYNSANHFGGLKPYIYILYILLNDFYIINWDVIIIFPQPLFFLQ